MPERDELLLLYHKIHRLIELGKKFMHVCYVEPLIERFNVRPHEFDILMRVYNYSLAHPEGITLKLLTAMLNISQPAVSMTVTGVRSAEAMMRCPTPFVLNRPP